MMQDEDEMGGHVVAEHRIRNSTAIPCERPLRRAKQAGAAQVAHAVRAKVPRYES